MTATCPMLSSSASCLMPAWLSVAITRARWNGGIETSSGFRCERESDSKAWRTSKKRPTSELPDGLAKCFAQSAAGRSMTLGARERDHLRCLPETLPTPFDVQLTRTVPTTAWSTLRGGNIKCQMSSSVEKLLFRGAQPPSRSIPVQFYCGSTHADRVPAIGGTSTL